MPAVPRRLIAELRRYLADADPERVTTAQAAELVADFVELERLAAAGKTLFADRAAASEVWARQGHDGPDSWLADLAQVPLGEAKGTFDTSRRLRDLPPTAEALRGGRLSGPQVQQVARAASADPSAEADLLELAAEKSLKHLRDRARQVLAQAASAEEEARRYERLVRKRFCRHWIDHEGGFRLEARLAPDRGARLAASLQAEADAVFAEARAGGRRDSPDAYRADALVDLVTGSARTGPGGSQKPRGRRQARTDTVSVLIDLPALRRGHVASGERCEAGGVSVPVAAVREMLPDAWVKVLLCETKQVAGVCHVGRTVTAHTFSALEVRDRSCVWPGCSVTKGLEAHHWRQDFAVSGTTSLDELALLCQFHHDLVTYRGFVLEGGPDHWRYRAPPPPEILQPDYADTG